MSSNIRTAMVLAAGIGSRMQGVIDYPKCMIQLGNKSLIDHILCNLYDNDITHVVINCFYKKEILIEHIKKLDIYNKISIQFSIENELLETAGGVKNALPLLNCDEFFVLNTDVYWPHKTSSAISILREHWNNKQMQQLLLLISTQKAFGYKGKGDFDLTNNWQLTRAREKRDYVYIGMHILHKSFFDNVLDGKIGFPTIWSQRQAISGELDHIYGTVFDGKWLHIGDQESKIMAEEYFTKIT